MRVYLIGVNYDFVNGAPLYSEVLWDHGYFTDREEALQAAQKRTEEAEQAWQQESQQTAARRRETHLYPELRTPEEVVLDQIFGTQTTEEQLTQETYEQSSSYRTYTILAVDKHI